MSLIGGILLAIFVVIIGIIAIPFIIYSHFHDRMIRHNPISLSDTSITCSYIDNMRGSHFRMQYGGPEFVECTWSAIYKCDKGCGYFCASHWNSHHRHAKGNVF